MNLSSIKSSTARTPSTINLPESRKSEWSTYHLYTMRKSVEEKGKLNSGINEQMKMQRQNSQKLLSRIQSSMLQTQQSTVDFLTRYEEQKIKNQQQLQKLVAYYEKEIAQQKLQRHNKTMQNIQINEFEGLKTVLKDKEKQLETVTNRLNASQCEKTAKYDTVKAQRRERILFSNQFNGFQNQLFDLEYRYKGFLIERVLLERIFEEKQLEFTKVRTQWEREIKRCEQESNQIYQQQVNGMKNPQQSFHPYQQSNNLVPQLKPNPLSSKQTFYRSRGKLRMQRNQLSTRNLLNEINEKKMINLSKLKIIKDLLNGLELDSFQELKQLFAGITNENIIKKGDDLKPFTPRGQPNKSVSRLQQLEQHNQRCTEKISKLEDEIYEWNKTIDNLQYQVQHHPNHKLNVVKQHQNKGYNNCLGNKYKSKTQMLVQQLTKQLDQYKESIVNFNESENLHSLIKSLEIDQQNDDLQQMDSHSINVPLLSQIQEKLTQLMKGFPDNKYFVRSKNDRRSLISWEIPHLQHQQKDSSYEFTQKSICPLLGAVRNQRPKKQKTIISRQISSPNGLKKLASLLKNQSKTRGSIDIASKDQLIRQATQAFDKQGITKMGKFQVKYT